MTKKSITSGGLLKRAFSVLLSVIFLVPLFAVSLANEAGAYSYIAYGIDVSSWQGTIDWDGVKSAGIDFVILRAGTTNGKDSNFEYNYLGAKSRGINVGAYYYTYALTEAEAIAEAETVSTWLNGKTLEYPIFFDIEDPSQESLSVEERTNMCIAFNTTLENKGYFAGVYASKSWLNSYLDRELLSQKYAIWEASWRLSGLPELDKSEECQLWQYSAEGSVTGISGNVDMDVSYIDYPSLIRKVGMNGFAKGSTDSTIAAYYKTTASSLTIRTGPATTYDAIGYAPNGSTVLVLDVNPNGTWSKVIYNGMTGWLSNKYVDLLNPVPLTYTVSYEAGADGAETPEAKQLSYGAPLVTEQLADTENAAFKGWNIKRVSDNTWYTEENGWISEAEAETVGKALLSAGETVYFDESTVVLEAGSDSFVLTGVWEPLFRVGDINKDGVINSRDTMLMKLYVVGKGTAELELSLSDLDGDGKIISRDILLMKKFINGLITEFPVEQG